METKNDSRLKKVFSKVPEVTIFFWIIKVLCTTVGETASDFLNISLGLGLSGTSFVMGLFLLFVLFLQFKAKKYVPVVYWLTVVVISIFGTLVTDILTDKMKVPLEASTSAFTVALMITFATWYYFDKTLSIHSIFTKRREVFYWLAILFTFALGTATGDLMAEKLGLGYLVTGIIVLIIIVLITIAWRLKLDPVLSFWIAYIMTRPLGASVGDYLSQAQSNGGLGIGATVTSAIFILAIFITVIFLTISKRDVIPDVFCETYSDITRKLVVPQAVSVIAILLIFAGTGYFLRFSTLAREAKKAAKMGISSKDLSVFKKIATETLILARAGNLYDAKNHITELESSWDTNKVHLEPKNPSKWTELDNSIDNVLRELRSIHNDKARCVSSLESLITEIDSIK